MALASWNALDPAAAQQEVLACCASPVWARAVAAGRPYPDLPAVLAAAADHLAELTWTEVEAALSAHPRIGRPHAAATGTAHREAAWSRREQAGATGLPQRTATDLAEANRRYEQRFGHIFLVFASGRSADEMLAEAHRRLGNDVATEREEVRGELGRIVRLRLQRLFGDEEAP